MICAGVPAAAPHAGGAVELVTASCYDAAYFDGLTSRYSADGCAGAASATGYAAAAYHNTSAKVPAERAADDGVFFFAGHAVVLTTQGDAGSTLVYETPDASGSLEGLASTPGNTALSENALVQVCSAGGGCRTQLDFPAYDYVADKVNLVVAEACNTAQNGTLAGLSVAGFAQGAYNQDAGTAIGFHDEILFPVGADDTGQYGDGWANRFWSDLGAGVDYTTAMVDAANSVGNGGGLGSYVEYHHSGAPTTLAPIRVYVP